MQPARSEGSKVDQFFVISCCASVSDFMQMSRSPPLPGLFKLIVTLPAAWHVARMSMVGTCARAVSPATLAKPATTAARATALLMTACNRRIVECSIGD